MKVRFLGVHSIETSEARLPGLLVDGVMALDAGSITASLSLVEQERLKFVMLTHHHFDHCRDLVTLCMNVSLWKGQIAVYGLARTLELVAGRLLDGTIYVRGAEYPSLEKPSLKLEAVEPYKEFEIAGYAVLPVPVRHAVPTVGFQVTSRDGRSFFYTGDTGPGFSEEAACVSPEVLITEVTGPEQLARLLVRPGHLSPGMLKAELVKFREIKGYLPKVLVVHFNPLVADEIGRELEQVAMEIGADIRLAQEGMVIEV